ANTTAKVTTDSFYWANRIIAGLADPHYAHHVGDLDDYQETTMAWGHARINKVDRALAAGETVDFEAENQAMSDQIQEATDQLLDKILLDASNLMTNHFSLSD
ncbi:MAG: C69 family dipeptidase, partial [Streptococcus parasanguinis]|nr:C69 family dipeptidase [Streptococcus parasanguinis]